MSRHRRRGGLIANMVAAVVELATLAVALVIAAAVIIAWLG